jgi:signal peptidase II
MAPKTPYFLAAFVIGFVADQASKQWILDHLHYGEVWTLIDGFFDITHVRNPGGAWSLFAQGDSSLRMPFFIGAAFLAIVLLLYFFRRLEPDMKLSALALGMVFGGALGNLTDRIRHGEVVDYLQFHLLFDYTFPTFNVADSLIVVGVILLMVETFFEPVPESELEQVDADPATGVENAGSSAMPAPSRRDPAA